jgi:signal transduction histidine kinase
MKLGGPDRLTGTLFAQVLALALLVLAAAEAVNSWIIFNLPPPTPDFYTQGEIVSALHGHPGPSRYGAPLMVTTSPTAPAASLGEHPGYERFREAVGRDLGVNANSLVVASNQRPPDRWSFHVVRSRLSQEGQSRDEGFLFAPFTVGLKQPNGQWTLVTPTHRAMLAPWQQRVLIWFGLSALAVAPISYLFARRLASPFAIFAAAAERLGRDPRAPPLTVRGSAEIRMATSAFNDMQNRLRRYVDDRTSMIAAIAHDLRTPLTRLRFRVESAPEELRAKMSADIDQMEAMIAATLAFVRDTASEPQRSRLELSSLLESVVDDMADTGANVKFEPAERVVLNGDSLALRRLFSNLLENARKFGGAARANLSVRDGSAVVEIDDDGPGVPPAELERVFDPFYRREPSRNRQTGGIGLGLSVARSIARSHGGDLVLENRVGGGLTARATLPL